MILFTFTLDAVTRLEIKRAGTLRTELVTR